MKKVLFSLLVLSNSFAWGQCIFNLTVSDTLLCPGDSVTLTASGPTNELTTTFSAGNNHRGNMFDIVATNDVVIESFDAHPMGNTDIAIYYKVGTFVGSEANSAAWILVGTATGVVANPQGIPTPVPVAVNVAIPAGQTYAFYVTSTNVAVSLNYSNGTTVGNVYSSDANISFLEGAGLEYPFTAGGGTFTPRIFNGIIHYSIPGTTSFSWNTGDTVSSITVVPTATMEYVVTTDASGCATNIDSALVSVSTIALDLGADLGFCPGGSVMLDAGSNADTYVWNVGDTTQTIVADTAGTYTVSVSDTLGCVLSDSIVIAEYTAPIVDLGSDTTICVYNSINLSAGAGFSAYDWSTSETTSTISLDGATLTVGTYPISVTVTDNNGCMDADTMNITVDQCLGLNELGDMGVSVYPNPFSGVLYIECDEFVSSANLNIYSIDGKCLLSETINGSTHNVDLTSYQQGQYIIEITTSSNRYTTQVTK